MPAPTTTVFCPAGRFTQVVWTSFAPFRLYRINAGSASIRWRRFSAGIPFYWEGMFTGTTNFFFPPDPYISLEFNPSFDTTVSISLA